MTEDDNGGVSAGRGVRLPEITPPPEGGVSLDCAVH